MTIVDLLCVARQTSLCLLLFYVTFEKVSFVEAFWQKTFTFLGYLACRCQWASACVCMREDGCWASGCSRVSERG